MAARKPVLIAIALCVACAPVLAQERSRSPYERFIETTRPLAVRDGVARPAPAGTASVSVLSLRPPAADRSFGVGVFVG